MQFKLSRLAGWAPTLACALAGMLAGFTAAAQQAQADAESVRSSPKDLTEYTRQAQPSDLRRGRIHPKVFLRDVVVSNTDPTLRNTDTFNDGEISIAVNPLNHDEIVVTSFAGSWGANAPLWHSTDRGATWTKRFSIAMPPGIPATGCPCDQTVDYGKDGILAGTFLTVPTNVYTGTTNDPSNAAAWQWLAPGGVTARTNLVALNNADQPWVLVNRDPSVPGIDNTYVAYDDFGTFPPDMRVAVSAGTNPPSFVTDVRTGVSSGFVNPGHRMAKNTITGTVYSLFQRRIAPGAGGSQRIDYMLNRSTDGGATWPLGAGQGIVVATADSSQPRPKFGTVNALLGGVLHAAVHAQTGDLYYVYGHRDPTTGNNRLAIRRITTDGAGDLVIGPESFVTGQVNAALPSVAVTPNGEVGVFHYTFDGFDAASGFPVFTAHVAISSDRGATFTDTPLLTFLSSAKDNGNDRQRVLGDYMQMKAAGGTFFGAFTANGVGFGRPFANHDPIFFRVQATGPR